ncbi:MAG: phosphoribosylamine--glycine ligase [Actinomycetota bacterium]
MRALVVGGGGREHALVWGLHRSASVDKVFAAPGNAGISELAACEPIAPTDKAAIADFALANNIDLVVIGPEQPLVEGLSDSLSSKGLRVFGPSAKAARIEGSKAFAKNIMKQASIPTARSETFHSVTDAMRFIDQHGAPCVVKADGLAAGKGVTVCETVAQAKDAARECLESHRFGAAGATIVIEEALTGEEISVFVVTDGSSVVPLAAAQDHKRLLDHDRGPNTGGMGAYSPVPHLDIIEQTVSETFEPLVSFMKKEGSRFKGVLFGGFMVTSEGPKVLEFNARFGDPETQAIVPRLQSDLGELLLACADGSLESVKPEWSEDACASVVLAGAGYPERSDKGTTINGLAEASSKQDVYVFHAGTKFEDGCVVTNGGRVLAVSACGKSIHDARSRAYDAVGKISFEGMQFRSDIANKGGVG